MFKYESCENEIIENMNLNLKKIANENSNNNLIKAVDNLDKAAQIFENIGIASASNKIMEVLSSLK